MRSSKSPLLILVAGLLMAPAAWSLSKSEQAISERIQPAGKVCIEGDASCARAVTTAAATGPRSGEEIYNKACMGCHTTGAAGAPKLGDAAAWSARMEKGLETLVSNAINGIAAMPPMGLCMDCSDEEIKVTVQYIIDNSQ